MRYLVWMSVAASIGIGSIEATAADAQVRAACTSDYLAYCGQHDPDGAGVRQCMRVNGARLSSACVNALVAAGEVRAPVVARQMKPKRVKSAESGDD